MQGLFELRDGREKLKFYEIKLPEPVIKSLKPYFHQPNYFQTSTGEFLENYIRTRK